MLFTRLYFGWEKIHCVHSPTHIQDSCVGKKMTNTMIISHKIMFKCNVNTTKNCLFLVYFEQLKVSRNITASKLIPVAMQSKAWVFGRLLAQTADMNPTGGTNVHLF